MKRIENILFLLAMAFITLSAVLCPTHGMAQMPIKYNMVNQVQPDSADVAYYGKKTFLARWCRGRGIQSRSMGI